MSRDKLVDANNPYIWVFILLDKRRKTQALVSLYAWSCKADVYESLYTMASKSVNLARRLLPSLYDSFTSRHVKVTFIQLYSHLNISVKFVKPGKLYFPANLHLRPVYICMVV